MYRFQALTENIRLGHNQAFPLVLNQIVNQTTRTVLIGSCCKTFSDRHYFCIRVSLKCLSNQSLQ